MEKKNKSNSWPASKVQITCSKMLATAFVLVLAPTGFLVIPPSTSSRGVQPLFQNHFKIPVTLYLLNMAKSPFPIGESSSKLIFGPSSFVFVEKLGPWTLNVYPNILSPTQKKESQAHRRTHVHWGWKDRSQRLPRDLWWLPPASHRTNTCRCREGQGTLKGTSHPCFSQTGGKNRKKPMFHELLQGECHTKLYIVYHPIPGHLGMRQR